MQDIFDILIFSWEMINSRQLFSANSMRGKS